MIAWRRRYQEFIELLPAQQRIENSWYSGTANAVYQNLDIIRSHHPQRVLILGGDHIYKMDYGPMLAFHVDSQADLTMGCVLVPVAEAKSFGVVSVDANNRIRQFVEKPSYPSAVPGRGDSVLASMGVYIFNTDSLLFINVQVNSCSRISNSQILPDTVIGEDCYINRAIIEKGTIIPDGSVIGENLAEDCKRFHVSSEGIVLATPDMLGQALHFAR